MEEWVDVWVGVGGQAARVAAVAPVHRKKEEKARHDGTLATTRSFIYLFSSCCPPCPPLSWNKRKEMGLPHEHILCGVRLEGGVDPICC